MSKKKHPPKMPVKKEPEIVKLPEKKPVKAIIITAAAIVLVAAIVLTAIFVVKPALDDETPETTVSPTQQGNAQQSGEYVFVDYKGVSMPQEFVDILNQAEKDSKAACKEYGVAVEIGDIEVSMPEFVAYYYDRYSAKKQEVAETIETRGINMTGYNTLVLPNEQEYVDGTRTWAEEFIKNAVAALQEDYIGFNQAMEAKITMTDSEIAQLISEYDRIHFYSELQNKPLEEMFAETYCEGFTEAMFKAREIRLAYKQMYRNAAKEEIADGYEETMLDKTLQENMDDYTVLKGRVYLIEGDYDAVEASKISSEKEFIEYADNNHPRETFSAEIETRCNYVNKEIISSTFDPAVAEWMFDDERVPGEITVIEGRLYKYLVYIEELPYLEVSRKVMYCGYEYFEGITEQEIEGYRSEIQTFYDDWKANGESKEAFAEKCLEFFEEAEYDVRVNEFFYAFEEWIFDEARKPGDHTFIDSDAGCCAIYYLDENEDDFDWVLQMKEKMSSEDYLEAYQKEINDNYETNLFSKVINKSVERANVTISRKIEKEKEDK